MSEIILTVQEPEEIELAAEDQEEVGLSAEERAIIEAISPTATVTKSGDTATITITDKNGTTTAEISDGQDGQDGADGQDGQDGTDAYVWIRYAAHEPTQDSDMKQTADAWMGIYSGSSSTAPTTYTSYTWYNIKGATGQTGQAEYVWIRYAAQQPTQDSDMKQTADDWMGIYSGPSSTAPTTYISYTWYKIKGATGQTGPAAYVWIRYAARQPTQDSDMKTTADDWMGVYSGSSATAPTTYTSYTWYKIKGETGSVDSVYGNTIEMSSSDSTKVSDAIAAKISATEKGAVNGVAQLDSGGKVPASQLPSYVDDVLEYDDTSYFPVTGEQGKIYVAKDTGKTYRWSGSAYVELSTYDAATQSASGLMSAADKTKLDGIETGAQVNPSNSDIINLVYPVGSIYMSVSSTSPVTLFGGTWEQLKDRFLLGVGDTYTAGDTGGAASVSYTPDGTVGGHTLTTTEIPSHSHGLNSHTHSVGAHSHGLNSHKHSVGAHSHGLNSHTHGIGSYAAANNGGHFHYLGMYISSNEVAGYGLAYQGGFSDRVPVTTTATVGRLTDIQVGNHSHTLSGTSGAASGSTANSSAFDSGAASGSTANSTAFDSGAASGSTANSTAFDTGAASGNTASTGSGGSHSHGFTGTAATINTMPPYLVVYMWKRTA